ncbi:MBL fold metallo-hydrolase [Eubacteriales bacterium OttesenSCG-928-A19]|nr:MBL fold metallo-hydrolase [Eubacteriales bacterium OttesenSCG-928-A19]
MRITDRIYWVGSGAVGLSAEGDCHTYAIAGDDALALVDCGVAHDPVRILENMREDGLDLRKLRYCLLTHAHYDHAGGCPALRARGVRLAGSAFTDRVLREGPVAVYGLSSDAPWMRNWHEMPRSELDIVLSDGQTLDLGGITVRAIMTPGHSPDSVCYLAEKPDGRRELFSGDTVFYKGFISVLGVPLNDLAHYPEGMRALDGLRVDGLYPGHLMWVLQGGQAYIDIANAAFSAHQMPVNKPFS